MSIEQSPAPASEFAALYAADLTIAEIADRIGIHPDSARRLRDRLGLEKRYTTKIPPCIIEQVRTMLESGSSYSAVGKAIGKSRSAISGIVHRYLREFSGAVMVSRRVVKKQLPKANVVARKRVAKPPQFEPAEPISEEAPPADALMLQLHELTDATCRWPIGEPGTEGFGFCGLPVNQTAYFKTYCQHHCRIAYRPPQGAK